MASIYNTRADEIRAQIKALQVQLYDVEGEKMQGSIGREPMAERTHNAQAYTTAPGYDPVEDIFTYHAPGPEQQAHYTEIREAAKVFVRVLMRHVPPGQDLATALNGVRSTVMFANAAVALNGRSF